MFLKIYLDGPDLTGKTTLINKLNKATSYVHYIGDRSPLSCLVYNKFYNRNQGLEDQIRSGLKEDKDNIVLVITHDCDDELNKRYDNRGDELQTVKTIKQINSLYVEQLKYLLGDHHIKHLYVSEVMNMSSKEIMDYILS